MALQGSYAEMYRKQAMNYLAVDSVEDMVCRLTFRLRVNRNPLERKRDYVKRVFYMQDYAKELRLNPKAAEGLYRDFEQCNEEIYKVEKSYTGQRLWEDWVV